MSVCYLHPSGSKGMSGHCTPGPCPDFEPDRTVHVHVHAYAHDHGHDSTRSQVTRCCLSYPSLGPDGWLFFKPAPWRQPNGTRQQRRWAPAAAAVPSRYPLPCSPPFLPRRGSPISRRLPETAAQSGRRDKCILSAVLKRPGSVLYLTAHGAANGRPSTPNLVHLYCFQTLCAPPSHRSR